MIGSSDEARAYSARFVDPLGVDRLELYLARLGEENARQNLVSSASLAQAWQRHIADSIQLLAHAPAEMGCWADLGSGAGPPGLVIAIARPQWNVRLIESRKRRIEFLQMIINELGLQHCRVIGAKLEDVEDLAADVISARAFAPLPKLLRLSSRFSTPDTVWLLPKGRSAAKELEDQPSGIKRMFHVEHSATDPQAGILVGRGKPSIP